MATTTFYYPEGPLGPICDIVVPDEVAVDLGIDDGDGRVPTYGPIDLEDLDRITDGTARYITTRRCKQRTLSDGSVEYYDCVDDLNAPIGPPPDYPLIEPQYNWPIFSTSPWGLDDTFEGLSITPESCNPHDPDINIFPVKFYNANGTFVQKYQRERSNPVTFPVDSIVGYEVVGAALNATFIDNGGGISASFLSDGTGIQVNGTGTGVITLELEWDDNPNTSGQAIGTMVIEGQTFTQGNNSEGEQTRSFSVTGGNTYTWTFTGQSPDAGYQISGDGQTIEWDDDATNGFDNNATLRITSLTGTGSDVALRVTGIGDGQIGLELEWDDNPNTNGSALGTVTVNGQTLTQRGEKGKESVYINVTADTDYTLTIDGGSGAGGPGDGASGLGGYVVSDFSICFYDLDGTDCNATLRITSSTNDTAIVNSSAWSDDGNTYAVWVNPAICTLPCLQQEVTYFIDIPAAGAYTFTGGADDFFKVFLNNNTTPIIDGGAGIFNEEHERFHTGSYTPPYSTTQTLQAGTLKMVVQCTNSAAGFGSCDGAGNTYSTTPLYRYVNSTTGDHFTGTESTPPAGYVSEGILCHLFTYPFPGSFKVVDHEPGKPQSTYSLYGFPPFKNPPHEIEGQTVLTSLIYAKTNGNDTMWTTDATEGNSDSPAYALDTTNNANGFAFYGTPSPTTIVVNEGVEPFGDAFVWNMNPGGWYIKICRGSSCVPASTVPWVRSGPHSAWSDFMNTYAVYPSNSDPLEGVTHTATFSVEVPVAGDHVFEYAADNQGVFTLDGTQIATSSNFTGSDTTTITNLSAGTHTIGVSITNVPQNQDPDWTRNPAGIAWTLTPTGGNSSIDWVITGQSSDAGYRIRNNGQRIQWDDDASGDFDVNATMDIGTITQSIGSNISVSFSSDGTGLDVSGFGSADVRLDFEWDDNPNTSGLAVGTLVIANETFTQTSATVETFTIEIADQGSKGRGDNAEVIEVTDKKIKFTDADFQGDTDAEFEIISTSPGVTANFTGSNDNDLRLIVTGQGDVTLELSWDDDPGSNGKAVGELYVAGKTFDQSGEEGDETKTISVSGTESSSQSRTITVNGDAIIASSLDLNTPGGGNLLWHTRMDAGYEWIEV
tara:strand:- start:307 stop:3645 length:3339 start_codon:yes stop_codon:yes gene_type:complete